MNFKLLAAQIAKHKLWERPLNTLTQEEILSLGVAFDTARTGQDKTCGTCWYYGWKKLVGWCLHPEHPAKCQGWAWGMACKDWAWEFDKRVGDVYVPDKKPLAEGDEE